MTAMPGRSHTGPLPPLSDEGRALAERLHHHVAVLARSERNADLETAARYIESAFGSSESQYFESGGRTVRNIQSTKPASIVVGDLGARALVRRSIASFRKHARFPSEGVAAPAAIPGVSWSDHWSFRKHGFPAIMVTDTAFYRYPHYHLPSDTPEKLDYERMARVTLGLAAMLRDLADEAR